VLLKLAWSERAIGEHEAAIAHYARALEIAPRQGQALEGMLHLALADGRSVDAERWIESYFASLARRGMPASSEVAYYYRARIRAGRGEVGAARADLISALRSDPRSSRAALELGDLERGAGRWAEAASAYQRALLALDPHLPSDKDDRGYSGLVIALERQGRQVEACTRATAWSNRRSGSDEARAAREQSCS